MQVTMVNKKISHSSFDNKGVAFFLFFSWISKDFLLSVFLRKGSEWTCVNKEELAFKSLYLHHVFLYW